MNMIAVLAPNPRSVSKLSKGQKYAELDLDVNITRDEKQMAVRYAA